MGLKSGPNTLGLAPKEYRFIRMKELMGGLDFAKKINVKDVVTHAGFIPENPSSTEYFWNGRSDKTYYGICEKE